MYIMSLNNIYLSVLNPVSHTRQRNSFEQTFHAIKVVIIVHEDAYARMYVRPEDVGVSETSTAVKRMNQRSGYFLNSHHANSRPSQSHEYQDDTYRHDHRGRWQTKTRSTTGHSTNG